MFRRALALFSLLAGAASCAGGERSNIGVPEPAQSAGAEAQPDEEAADAGSDAAEGDAGVAEPEAEPEEPKPDPSVIKLALDRTGQPTDIENAPYGLRFELVEQGPELPWAIAVVNRGTETVKLAHDPRLLRLEVEPPPPEEEPVVKGRRPKPKPKRKTLECKLPDNIRPAKVDQKLVIELGPGEGVVETFDPRLYCLPVGGKSPFEPGARVTARLGFPVKKKTVWRKGKRVEEPLPQTAPFVAVPASAGEDEAKKSPPAEPAAKGKAGAATAPAELGVKELVSTPFSLGADYAPKPPPEAEKPPVLEVLFTRGADARSEETATVTVRIQNRSDQSQHVFYRRELLSFEVSGPDGRVTCDPQPDSRAPDRQAFRLLRPGGAIVSTSRLIELCPDDTFARPGLYLAHARFEASEDGSDFQLEAVTGLFVSENPAVIRIRTGELPFLGRRVMQRVKVGE